MDQQKLINGLRDRNSLSQRELVRLFGPYLFSVCRRYVNDDASAKDILQDSFLKIFDAIDSFKGEASSFKYWMRRITINKALQKFRVSSYTKETYPETLDHNEPQSPTAFSHLGVEEIMNLLEHLTEDQKKVFNLYIIDGFSHKEIAQQLSIEIGTSRTLLLRSRKTMQRLILKRNEYEAKAI